MAHDIEKSLARLDRLIADGPDACVFNDPASSEDIAAFEARHNVKLPLSYKRFLEFTNGGMILDRSLYEQMKLSDDKASFRWNANYIYGIQDVEREYDSMASRNFGLPFENIATYPFIPFLHTESGEHLVFINLKGDEEESAVLDAYHEETPETWGTVSASFTEFLDAYMDNGGHPNLLGELADGNAYEMVKPQLAAPSDEEESPEEVIAKANDILSREPDRHWQLVLRSIAYRDTGMLAQALDDINRAIDLFPGDAFYHYSRGEVYRVAGKLRPALIDFDTAVKIAPSDPLYLCSRGDVLADMNKLDAALKDTSEAIRINDSYMLAYMIREGIYREMGEAEKADADARKIDELSQE